MAAVSDADVAGTLFEQYEQGLYRFCLSRLRSREDAEDAVQTTFVRAVRALERGVRPEVAPAWLFTIARNVCSSRRLAALRRARVETPRDLDHVRASALAREDEHPDELIGLRDALAEMPPKLQRVVLLREWQGLSYDEIGAELGVSESAVETLLFRARRDLAKRLRGLLDLGPLLGLKALLGGATVAAVTVAIVHDPSVQTKAVAPDEFAVPHPSTLPSMHPVVQSVHRARDTHAARVRVPPPVVVRSMPTGKSLTTPRPLPVRPHRPGPADVAPRSSAEPAQDTPPTVAVASAPPAAPPEPTAAKPGGRTSSPAAPEPVTPVAAAVRQTVATPVEQTASTVTAPVEQAASTVTAPVEQTASTVTAPVEQTASTVTTPVEQTASTVTAPVEQTASTLLPGG